MLVSSAWMLFDAALVLSGTQLGLVPAVSLHSGFDLRPAGSEEVSDDPLPALL